MKIPVFDTRRQYDMLRDELLPALEEVMSRGQYILGENVHQLELEIARLTETQFGVGVANGSDALHLALLACGVGPGDEVIVPAFTFFATAGAVARLGARPVFIDVDPVTFTMNPELVVPAISPRTKAIIPVHLFGQACNMEELVLAVAGRDIRIVEDAAQAIGAVRNDVSVCSFGDAGCLSFFPTKNLGGFGDGGMIVTNDEELATKVRMLRVHGSKAKYYHVELGYNSRLDELQAAVLRCKVKYLSQWTAKRQEIAQHYTELLTEEGLLDYVIPPTVAEGNTHVFHQYTIRAKHRDELRRFLMERGIGTAVYYPLPLHLQPVFNDLGYQVGDLPNAEALAQEVLSLPMYPELSEREQEAVVSAIASFYR